MCSLHFNGLIWLIMWTLIQNHLNETLTDESKQPIGTQRQTVRLLQHQWQREKGALGLTVSSHDNNNNTKEINGKPIDNRPRNLNDKDNAKPNRNWNRKVCLRKETVTQASRKSNGNDEIEKKTMAVITVEKKGQMNYEDGRNQLKEKTFITNIQTCYLTKCEGASTWNGMLIDKTSEVLLEQHIFNKFTMMIGEWILQTLGMLWIIRNFSENSRQFVMWKKMSTEIWIGKKNFMKNEKSRRLVFCSQITKKWIITSEWKSKSERKNKSKKVYKNYQREKMDKKTIKGKKNVDTK